jgi:hypothetical protein
MVAFFVSLPREWRTKVLTASAGSVGDLCAEPGERGPLPSGLAREVAAVALRRTAEHHAPGARPYHFLALSGGGLNGAFGIGVLQGWTIGASQSLAGPIWKFTVTAHRPLGLTTMRPTSVPASRETGVSGVSACRTQPPAQGCSFVPMNRIANVIAILRFMDRHSVRK